MHRCKWWKNERIKYQNNEAINGTARCKMKRRNDETVKGGNSEIMKQQNDETAIQWIRKTRKQQLHNESLTLTVYI